MKDTEKTLRDEFAMAALTGILDKTSRVMSLSLEGHGQIANLVYSIADAMLAEREKPCPTKT